MKIEKKCYKCQNTYPYTPEFYARSGQGQLDRICKTCKAKWNKEYYATHPRPVISQKYIGCCLIRYSKRKDIWTVFKVQPWTRLGEFETEAEAEEWVNSNYHA